jgi:hypothetical protein
MRNDAEKSRKTIIAALELNVVDLVTFREVGAGSLMGDLRRERARE